MSTWLWVIVGTAAFVVLSVAVSVALASLLGRISEQEEAELVEAELWSIASLTREQLDEEPEPEPEPITSGLGVHWPRH
jgi:type II secretory pathway pseudopilin PulG